MYSVNGIGLDNPTFGWIFRAPSKPLSEFTHEVEGFAVQGRDGVVAGIPSTTRPVSVSFMVQTPKVHLETLVALFGRSGMLSVTGDASREVFFETLTHSLQGYGAAESIVDAAFILRFPGAFWRSKLEATASAPMSAASVALAGFPGISAPIPDALVRVKGQAGGVQVTDVSGAWVLLPDATAGQWVRFESGTGKCFLTTADTWTGGTDVSGLADFGGPRNVFEVTPALAPADPSSRQMNLTVTSSSRSGAVIEVRGKNAHAL